MVKNYIITSHIPHKTVEKLFLV